MVYEQLPSPPRASLYPCRRSAVHPRAEYHPDTIPLSHPLRFDVNLVQVDAVVTDSHDQRVSGLTAEDFEVLQDGKPQAITHFLYVPATAPAPQPSPASPQLTKSEARRVFLIYIDDRVMSFADFAAMRRALGRFIDEDFQTGDLCAFYRATGGSGAWRAFSSDPRQARAALDHMTWLRQSPILRNPNLLESNIRNALDALASMPGRKALVLVNSGVAFNRHSPHDSTALILFPMARRLGDWANRASAVIYSIDARGLAVVGTMVKDDWKGGPDNVPRSGAELARKTIFDPLMEYNNSQAVPEILSDMTGGLAFHDTNDLFGALGKIAADEQGYYLLAWNPGNGAFDLKGREVLYHSIKIRMRKTGLKARSRAGYFGMPEGYRTHVSPRSRMLFALGSPFREEDIPVNLTASLQSSAALGPHIEALLHVGPQGVDFTRDDRGCRVAHLDVATMAQHLGDDFDPNDMHGQLATIETCGSAADRAPRDGFVFVARENVTPGPYVMHVVVRNVPPGGGAVLSGLQTRDSDPNAVHPPVHIGSASEFVNVPDPRAGAALSGIALRLDGAPQPPDDSSWRPPVAGDPAIRDFHPGDVISYQASVIHAPARDWNGAAELQVLFEGKQIGAEHIQSTGDSLHGSYRIDSNAPAGQYLLGIAISGKSGKGKEDSVQEWINFQVAGK